MKRTNLLDVRLEPNKDDRAQVMCIGDVHFGAANCDVELFKKNIASCVERKIYVLAMGDMIDVALIGSVSDVYEQKATPDEQIYVMVDMLKPLADAGLLLGIIQGNHEKRIVKTTSINVTVLMAKMLNTRYFGHSCFLNFRVGKEVYCCYATHGSSGARLSYSKIKAALDVFRYVSAEIICYGHLHGYDHMTQLFHGVDRKNKTIKEATRHAILTGSYLRYRDSYAEEKNLPPVQMGSPLISLYGDQHCIHVSL